MLYLYFDCKECNESLKRLKKLSLDEICESSKNEIWEWEDAFFAIALA